MIRSREDFSKIHVVFLHNRLRKRAQDRYLIDLARGIQSAGHKVTIYTSECYEDDAFEEVNPLTGLLDVRYSCWWIPNGLKFLRSTVMALSLILFPPKLKPDLIILDINAVALYVIAMLSNYKTVYLAQFYSLQKTGLFSKYIKMNPNSITAHCIKYADEIVVQTEGFSEVLRRSIPNLKNKIRIIYPAMDTGLWKEQCCDISALLDCVLDPIFLFVCFGSFKKESNFNLALEAFETLRTTANSQIKNNLHLVLAGHYHENRMEQAVYYNEVLESVKSTPFASQVTILKELPTIYKKTLIERSIAVIVPSMYDVFPDTILAALAAGKPIIATNAGFAKEALRHRLTGILVKPSPIQFAMEMERILACPSFHTFLSNMALDIFRKRYSNNAFKMKINEIVCKYA